MKPNRRPVFFGLSFIFFIFFHISAQTVPAQKGWQINRAKGSGDLISVFFTSEKDGWIAGDRGFLAYTKDGGETWNKQILNTAQNINEIYFRSDDDGYLVAGRKMFVTKDGGKNWREEIIVNQNQFRDGIPEFLSIRFNSRKQGLIIGTIIHKNNPERIIGSLILRTEDGGETWTRISVPTKVELFHLDFDGKKRGWIVGDLGTILATDDSGKTWSVQTSGTRETLYNVKFLDDENGFAVGSGGVVLKTETGGDRWSKVSDDFAENTFFRIDFAGDERGWITGSDGVILRTDDGGDSWRREESGTANSLYGLFMHKKFGWSVGKNGVIIRYKK